MINDPLLPSSRRTDESSTWAPPSIESVPSVDRMATGPAAARLSAPRPSRRRHPALSARILAVGISTSAMFALTAAYASAEQRQAPQPVEGGAAGGTNPASATANSNGASATQPRSNATPRNDSQQAAPRQTQPNVVQVPVEPVAPAWPGSGGGNPQQSSGSN